MAAAGLRKAAGQAVEFGAQLLRSSAPTAPASRLAPAWVFLGPPGVGKGTYSTRVAEALGIPHIAAGDLVREEIKNGSTLGKMMASVVNSGRLLDDRLILDVLQGRLERGQEHGETGVLLDGFPRTRAQAVALGELVDVQLALNLHVNEEILIAKCLGRRICGQCGKNYNLADIYIPAGPNQPEVRMPPLNPPAACEQHMERRSDDTLQIVQKRLQVYHESASPVEDFYREHGVLLDFSIYGGIPQTLPRLMSDLAPFRQHMEEYQNAQPEGKRMSA